MKCRTTSLTYELSNLQLRAGEALNASLLDDGQAISVGSTVDGKDQAVVYDLRVSRGVSPKALQQAKVFPRVRSDAAHPVIPLEQPPIPPPPGLNRRL